ncbi:serine repeat antigen 4, putative (SERA4) [Plasmodium ovale wallikeri]|uniref:Serine repeat antigen 4, putative (SERA4) n=1 Tax=Plasmodium ovale wallikeri TaxID=864142 RepID=A0A1A8YLR1_PLAOA|nr:serine repeat antigen 4, putative (SERA4) [Plasmodium ovale wallikeri]
MPTLRKSRSILISSLHILRGEGVVSNKKVTDISSDTPLSFDGIRGKGIEGTEHPNGDAFRNHSEETLKNIVTSSSGGKGQQDLSKILSLDEQLNVSSSVNSYNIRNDTILEENVDVKNLDKWIHVTSTLLKNVEGIKVTGLCKAHFRVFFVPHIWIYVLTTENKIHLKPSFELNSSVNVSGLHNKCSNEGSTTFNFVVYIEGDVLTLKWRVNGGTPIEGENGKRKLGKSWRLQKGEKNHAQKDFPLGRFFAASPFSTTKICMSIPTGKRKVHNYRTTQPCLLPPIPPPLRVIYIYPSVYGKREGQTDREQKLPHKKPNARLISKGKKERDQNGGRPNIEHCYHCTLLAKKYKDDSECFNYITKKGKKYMSMDIKIRGDDDAEETKEVEKQQEEEETADHKLRESIDTILKNIFKNDKYGKKELILFEELDESLKGELMNYCKLLKEVDVSGTLQMHELANIIETFKNLTRMLKMHAEENVVTLQDKLRNAAICVKNINEWVVNKRGLLLPDEMHDLERTHYDVGEVDHALYDVDQGDHARYDVGEVDHARYDADQMDHARYDADQVDHARYDADQVDHALYDADHGDDLTDGAFERDENGIINLRKSPRKMKLKSPYFKNSKYCNNEYCDRWKDKTSCISNIEVEEQGECGLCWIFASKLHLETIRCMRGYGHFRSSALFIANCSKRKHEDICNVGSNPIEFLQIVHETKFLPLESDYPYSYSDASNACPKKRNKWTNLWGNTKLLYHKKHHYFMNTLGYVSYESFHFKNNLPLYIELLKREIQSKGSIIVYIKTNNVIDYDFNGRIVHNLCGDDEADHAANVVGYGNYINNDGEKRSYWIIRNSWGYYWGDEGNFKVDMHGPEECKYNFIHTAVVFKMDLGIVEVPKKNNNVINNFLKYVPNFFYSLFYYNYDKKVGDYTTLGWDGKGDEKKGNTLLGQSEEGEEAGIEAVRKAEGVAEGVAESVTESVAEGGGVAARVHVPSAKGARKQIDVLHILKYVKDEKVRTGFVKYDDIEETERGYSCSRIYSKNSEKHNLCKEFCLKNWNVCKNHNSPGYCLTELYPDDSCFFCNI